MVDEVSSSMIYMIHCKNLCKCHNVSPSITTIKEKKIYFRAGKTTTTNSGETTS
jgi:hypothetical protein